MAKTKLLNSTREVLLEWMVKQHAAKSTEEVEKFKEKALEAANKAVRAKYPETDMLVLRKYKCSRIDRCLRFVNNDSGQVFGVNFLYEEETSGKLADLPAGAGCSRNDIFPVSVTAQKALESYEKAKDEMNKIHNRKKQEYSSFIASCKYLEEIDEIVPLPEPLKAKFIKGGALVSINPEIVASIKSDFKKAVA